MTIVSYSIGVGVALEAAKQLAGEGIDAEVIDLRTLRPLDKATVLESLKRTNRMVVVEEGWPTCSIASEIIAICMEDGFDDLDAPVLRVTDVDVPLPYAANLEKLALIKARRSGRGGEGRLLSLTRRGTATSSCCYLAGRTPARVRRAVRRSTLRWARSCARPASRWSAQIRLAWWRERLEELDTGESRPSRGLRAAAEVFLPRGINGAELAELADGWAGLLR